MESTGAAPECRNNAKGRSQNDRPFQGVRCMRAVAFAL